MLPASVTCPSLCLFRLAPCSSAWLSLCPSVSPSSLPHLLQPLCGLLLSLTILYLWLSQTPAHSSLGLSHPCLLSASFPVCLSVCLSSGIVSFSSPACPPFLASPVCPHHLLCLPQLSGKAVVIYELWTGPAAGAGGPPIKVSRRKLPAWDGRVTAFTEQPQLRARLSARDRWSAGEGPLLHSHLFGQTIKHLPQP